MNFYDYIRQKKYSTSIAFDIIDMEDCWNTAQRETRSPEKIIEEIESACGRPDAAQGCRDILKLCKELKEKI